MSTTPEQLNDLMEFDHVIEVDARGRVSHRSDVYAPDAFNGEVSDQSWEPLTGYSGQDRYTGPVMHDSEFIGGRMARDILAQPGVYVAVVCLWDEEQDEDEEDVAEGWMILRQKT